MRKLTVLFPSDQSRLARADDGFRPRDFFHTQRGVHVSPLFSQILVLRSGTCCSCVHILCYSAYSGVSSSISRHESLQSSRILRRLDSPSQRFPLFHTKDVARTVLALYAIRQRRVKAGLRWKEWPSGRDTTDCLEDSGKGEESPIHDVSS